jgi:creatinine amidohydrolase
MTNVRWAELRPDQFTERINACPLVYLPVGLCEPHGHVAALGLDTIRADWMCDQAARLHGGIVAPTQGYHIHESGYHAQWLEEVVGENNSRLGGIPPHAFCLHYLYQLRAFANAGFKAAVVVTGHLGGNQLDLQAWGDAFAERCGLPVRVTSDMLITDFPGDHAGRYEISALMYLRPDLVDMRLLNRQHEPGSGGRLALGHNAGEATREYGELVMKEALRIFGGIVESVKTSIATQPPIALPIPYEPVEAVYAQLRGRMADWVTTSPRAGQPAVSDGSRWKPYERPNLDVC